MQKPFQKFKFKNRHIKSIIAALLAAVLLLSGCGDPSNPSDQTDASQASPGQAANTNNTPNSPGGNVASDALNYRVIEKAIPDPKTIFENDPENQGKNMFSRMEDSVFENSIYADAKLTLSQEDSFSADGRLYFLYSILYTVEGEEYPYFTDSYCLCVLEAPYEQWRYYTFSSSGLSSDPTFTPRISRIAGASDDGVYLSPSSGGIGFYDWDGDGSCKLLEEISADSESGNLTLYPAGETLYAVSSDLFANGSFTSYDEQLKPVLTQNLENKVSGCISRDSEYLWYGFDANRNLTVWDKPNGTQLFSLGNMVDDYADFLLTRTAAGEFILADVSGIWIGKGDTPLQKILSFAEKGYALQELFAINTAEDGRLSLVVLFEDALYELTPEQTDTPDRQEITIVSASSPLKDVITAFNRQSDKYRIIYVSPYEDGDINAYCQQLQLEISAGRGPDLVESWLLDMDGCIRNGYVEPLDDIIVNPSEYWPTILENDRATGARYSIPYDMGLSFLAASESLTGGLDAWNLEQMMEAVKNSPAESLEMGLDSLDIVLQYGLTSRDNPQFIDYDAGVSHLTEQPFIDFLEFAKAYGDDLYYSDAGCTEAADYYLDGRLAVLNLTMQKPDDLLFAPACFQGQDVLIGMPSAQGRGVYMESNQICLNSSSQYKEGAREFLRYLLSAEGQLKYVYQNVGSHSHIISLSCRRDVTETILNDYQEEAKENWSASGKWGVYVEHTPLSEEQVEQFLALFEDARPKWSCPSEIYDIICEELGPYFAGDCPAEQAAGNLDNRIQLYFDERR